MPVPMTKELFVRCAGKTLQSVKGFTFGYNAAKCMRRKVMVGSVKMFMAGRTMAVMAWVDAERRGSERTISSHSRHAPGLEDLSVSHA
jgi:hypothetical protein